MSLFFQPVSVNSIQFHARVALGYFVLAALLGVVLRIFQWEPFPVTYKFMMHTHSHIALLGWVYVALMTLLYLAFLRDAHELKSYHTLFWSTQATIAGMLFTFPFQGYALGSILFSTLFLITSYWFAWLFLTRTPKARKASRAYRMARAGIGYMLLSSLGPWALGLIMNTLGPASDWYRMAIYFYLHFQYNGWMLMALMGLLFFVWEYRVSLLSEKKFRWFYQSMNAGILLSFFLSVLWTRPHLLVYLLAGVGALLQFLALALLLAALRKQRQSLRRLFSVQNSRLLVLVAALWLLKTLMQALTALPYFASLAASALDFVIGYLHLTFLGVISLLLFVLFDHFKMLTVPPPALRIYLVGFFVTEGLIFYKGFAAWQGLGIFQGYFATLSLASLLIPLALLYWLAATAHNRAGDPPDNRVQ